MLSPKILLELEAYINEHIEFEPEITHLLEEESFHFYSRSCEKLSIENYIDDNMIEDTFSSRLLELIDGKEDVTDADIYKAAGLDRRHFSKIRSNRDYKPKKPTVLALCLALELDLNQTFDLIELAGYSLSKGDKRDLIVRYCIENHIYKLMDVNEALAKFGEKILGAV